MFLFKKISSWHHVIDPFEKHPLVHLIPLVFLIRTTQSQTLGKKTTHIGKCVAFIVNETDLFSRAQHTTSNIEKKHMCILSWNSSKCWLVVFFSWTERHTACIWGWEFSFSFFWGSKFLTFPFENCSCPFFWGFEFLSVSCFHLRMFHFLRVKVSECFMLPFEKFLLSFSWGWEFLSVSCFQLKVIRCAESFWPFLTFFQFGTSV